MDAGNGSRTEIEGRSSSEAGSEGRSSSESESGGMYANRLTGIHFSIH